VASLTHWPPSGGASGAAPAFVGVDQTRAGTLETAAVGDVVFTVSLLPEKARSGIVALLGSGTAPAVLTAGMAALGSIAPAWAGFPGEAHLLLDATGAADSVGRFGAFSFVGRGAMYDGRTLATSVARSWCGADARAREAAMRLFAAAVGAAMLRHEVGTGKKAVKAQIAARAANQEVVTSAFCAARLDATINTVIVARVASQERTLNTHPHSRTRAPVQSHARAHSHPHPHASARHPAD